MTAYVIKSWKAQQTPMDASGAYVRIVGRAGGLISWMLAQLGIDPTVSFTVFDDKILFEKASLSGSEKRVIPMTKVSSSSYGFSKPLIESVVLGVLCGVLFLGIGAVVGVIYYLLNKKLTVGVVEDSGVVSAIAFKKSVIEGQSIDERQAALVCKIIEARLARQQLHLPQIQAIQQLGQANPLWTARPDA